MVWMVNIYKKMIVQGLSEGKNGYLRSHRTFNSSELRSKSISLYFTKIHCDIHLMICSTWAPSSGEALALIALQDKLNSIYTKFQSGYHGKNKLWK